MTRLQEITSCLSDPFCTPFDLLPYPWGAGSPG